MTPERASERLTHLADTAEVLASAADVDLDTAEAQLQMQAVYSDLTVQLHELGLDQGVVETRLTSRTEGASVGLVISLHGDSSGVNDYSRRFLADRGLPPGLVTLTSVPFSGEELSNLSVVAEDRIRELLRQAGYDPSSIYFNWTISSGGEVSRLETSDVEALTSAVAGSELDGAPITYVDWRGDESVLEEDGYIVGGNPQMYYSTFFQDYVFQCTSGFTMKDYVSGQWKYGLLTAGHCVTDGQLHYVSSTRNYPPSGAYQTYEANYFWSSSSNTRDAGEVFLSVQADASVMYNQVWDGTQFKNITAVQPDSGHMKDGFLCGYGFSSGRKCGWIARSANFDPDGSFSKWTTTSDVVEVTPASGTSTDGDSGGPWEFGNQAYGIHSSSNAVTGSWVYQKAADAQSSLGVVILTN